MIIFHRTVCFLERWKKQQVDESIHRVEGGIRRTTKKINIRYAVNIYFQF